MILSRFTLKNVNAESLPVPGEDVFELPEKVLQFGTGVLLRGLPDYFIDKANRQGIFNGRIVVVKSTDTGGSDAFDKQDGLYTICVRGIENGQKVEEDIISSSISRVLSAKEDWSKVLRCAHNPEMSIILSNTTEVGIQLVHEDIRVHPPQSFPGKLLAFLHERYKAFDGSAESGMVIVPTELIPGNGKKLEGIVLELAHLNGLDDKFIEWLETSNYFCNSLVDRIVPGKPEASIKKQLEEGLGYTDDLLIMSEVYRLWAIEGGEQVQAALSFAKADSGVIVAPDIDIYRELKLRLLNGTHTLSCGLAYLAGFSTVKIAMDDAAFSTFITNLMLSEIANAIPYDLPEGKANEFGLQVLDRFRNPHIEHQWISITMQYSSKMKMRNIPMFLRYYESHTTAPAHISVGFAAYLLFMKSVKQEGEKYFGLLGDQYYPINDDKAAYFHELWQRLSPEEVVDTVLSNEELWGADISQLNGFAATVKEQLNLLLQKGAKDVLASSLTNTIGAK